MLVVFVPRSKAFLSYPPEVFEVKGLDILFSRLHPGKQGAIFPTVESVHKHQALSVVVRSAVSFVPIRLLMEVRQLSTVLNKGL